MMTIGDRGVSPLAGFVRAAGLAACALLAAACHGGLDTPTAPNAGTLSTTEGDEAVSADAVASIRSAPVSYDMTEVDLSGYSGTCTLAAARSGFRLKAQGQGVPETIISFHLIRQDGFRRTQHVELNRQGTFRTGQTLVTSFSPGVEVRCVLLSLDGAVLAESATFHAP